MANTKKTARILFSNEGVYWTTQNQFWEWARKGEIEVIGHRPLTGRFPGNNEALFVTINHVVLDRTNPNHCREVIESYPRLKAREDAGRLKR